MIEEICEAIACRSPFSPKEIKDTYDRFGSLDLVLKAVDLCVLTGWGDLSRAALEILVN